MKRSLHSMSLVGVCVQVLDSEMTNQDAGAKIDGVDVSQVRVCHAVFYPDPQQPMPYRLKAAFPSLSPFSIATAEFLSTSVPRKFSTPTENRPIYTALPWGSSAAFRRRTCLIAAPPLGWGYNTPLTLVSKLKKRGNAQRSRLWGVSLRSTTLLPTPSTPSRTPPAASRWAGFGGAVVCCAWRACDALKQGSRSCEGSS